MGRTPSRKEVPSRGSQGPPGTTPAACDLPTGRPPLSCGRTGRGLDQESRRVPAGLGPWEEAWMWPGMGSASVAFSVTRLRHFGRKGALRSHRAVLASGLAPISRCQGHGLSQGGNHQGDPRHIQGPKRLGRQSGLPRAHYKGKSQACISADNE